jgi:hypothetical protein
MKPLLVLLAVVPLGLGSTACGGAGKGTGSASRASSHPAAAGGASATIVSGVAPALSSLKGDSDDDGTDEGRTNNTATTPDSDVDFDNDYKDNASKGYYDNDDQSVRAYGHAVSATDKHALTAVVERYYAAAAAGDGATACSLIKPSFARAIPEDYGQAPGPAYLRGAKTCPAVMSLLFRHSHGQLTGAIEVTGVRVMGNQAFVLLDSMTVPASFINVERTGGAWRIVGLLGRPLP